MSGLRGARPGVAPAAYLVAQYYQDLLEQLPRLQVTSGEPLFSALTLHAQPKIPWLQTLMAVCYRSETHWSPYVERTNGCAWSVRAEKKGAMLGPLLL